MRRWEPNADLQRLLDALSEEILAVTDQEARLAFVEARCSLTRTAEDVRRMIATSDRDEPGHQRAEPASHGAHLARPN